MSTEENLDEANTVHDDGILQLNNRLKTDVMSHCYSFLNDDEEAHQCVQTVWKKYFECVGDASMLAAFFDTLPQHVKTSALPKYQSELIQWFQNFFHFQFDTVLYSSSFIESLQRVIRYALKNGQYKKGIIYIPTDFDPNIKLELFSTISNIKFEHVPNNSVYEDMIDLQQLEELIRRDSNESQVYPLMVIANAGSSLLGRCDRLTKIKNLCEEKQIWFHVIGDLLGSLALLSTENNNLKVSCDSLTLDTMKLFGIQNLPYLTFYLRSQSLDENNSSISSHSLYEFILQSSSIHFLSLWSLTQRCKTETIIEHMKQSFDLTNSFIQRLKQIPTMAIVNQDEDEDLNTYQRLCSNETLTDQLPKSVVIFRFYSNQSSTEEFSNYIDLLNLWLFDKLSQQYPKMNLELLKSVNFQSNNEHSIAVHAIRFAPLEHLLDAIEQSDMITFGDDLQRYSDIILATMTARLNLESIVSKHDNLVPVPLPNWAGIGAVRYIPGTINSSEINETSAYEINSIQAELARNLQTNDSAFSLGGGTDEDDSMFYLRLGMIRKPEDLDILLQKISVTGNETELSLKYIEDMAEKIKHGIERAQQDLYNENLNLLAQDGILRQLPLVSNILSWWSPAPSSSPLAFKGRSFDLNSGQVESTEDTYTYHMQIKKQQNQAQTHNPTDEQSE